MAGANRGWGSAHQASAGEGRSRGAFLRAPMATAGAWGIAAWLLAGSAGAQSVARSSDPEPVLRRFGAGAAARGLSSEDSADRTRAVERLASLGTREARVALLDALEPGVLRGQARASALWGLAAFAAEDDVRSALSRELLQGGNARRDASGWTADTPRRIAALALARSGRDRALASLGAAITQGGPAAAAAREALLAHPPAHLEPIFGRVGPRARVRVDGRTLAPAMLAFLGELGDARSLPILRGALGAAAPAARIEAALALARLGDEAALTLTASAPGDGAVRVAAAEVRARLGHPTAAASIAELLGEPDLRAEGLRLAALAPSPALVEALAPIVAGPPGLEADVAVALVGAAGGAEAVAILRGLLDAPQRGMVAAVALGRSPGPSARGAIDEELARPADGSARSRCVVLAGLFRALALGDELGPLAERLEELSRRVEPGAAELGVMGQVALRQRDVDGALAARPSAVAELAWWGAVARGTLLAGPDARAELFEASRRRDGGAEEVAAAASLALLDAPAAARWPTSELLRASLGGTAAAPLVARELARRDDGSLRAHVDQLLTGVDPVIRAHAALGLGGSADAASASRLASLYAREDDPQVRSAAVRALSRRAEPQRLRILRLASELDPDASVRALAKVALAGRAIPDPPASRGDLALSQVEGLSGAAPGGVWSARLTRPDGLSVPVVVPSDGWLLVPGLGSGRSALSLLEPPLGLARASAPPHPASP